MTDKYKMGNFIYELRTSRNLSQKELGLLLGVSNKAVSKWEVGNNKPDLSALYQMAGIFDVSVDEILKGERATNLEKENNFLKSRLESLQKKNKRYEKFFLILSVLGPIVVGLCFYFIPVIYCKFFGIPMNTASYHSIIRVSAIAAFVIFVQVFMSYMYHKYFQKLNQFQQFIGMLLFPIVLVALIIVSIIIFIPLYIYTLIQYFSDNKEE